MVRFAVSLCPDKTLKGKMSSKAEIISWNFDEKSGISDPRIDSVSIPHIIPTKFEKNLAKSLVKIEKAVSDYKSFIKKKSKKDVVDLDKIIYLNGPFGRGSYQVFQLVTPPFDKSYRKPLKEFFYLNHGVKSQAELSVNFPFCILDKNLKPTGKRISLEALADGKAVAKDYETHNWQPIRVSEELEFESEEILKKKYLDLTKAFHIKFDEKMFGWWGKDDYIKNIESILNKNKDERITVSSIINLKDGENYLITTLDCGKDEILVEIPGQDKKVKVNIIKVKSQEELIKEDNRISEEMQALFVYGHNHLKFDYGKAEELTNNFKPGVDGKKAKHISQAANGFIVQRNAPGRIDIDPAGYAQHYMPTYNNKLDTVLEHVFGIKSKKTMTHDELALNTAKAENGDKKAAEEILYYAAQDSMKSFLLGEKLKKEHLLLSYAFNSLPSRFDTTAKKTLTEEYWINWHFKKKHSFPSRKPSSCPGFNDFNVVDHLKKELSDKYHLKPKKGLKECYLVAFFPFANVFSNLLKKDPNVKAIYERIKKTEDNKEKARLLRTLESLIEYPLFKLLDCDGISPELHEKRFAAEFELGFSGRVVGDYKNKINDALERIASVLEKHYVNSNNSFFILSAREDELKELTKDNLAVVLDKGRFLSGSRGRFAANLGGEFFMKGIADYRSNKGERCRFEKEFFSYFFEKFLMEDDLRSVLEYLGEKCRLLAKNKLDKSEIIFEREARRNSEDYSINAKQGYIDKMRADRTRKDDFLSYSFSIKELQEKFFGLKIDKKKDKKQKVLFSELDDSRYLDFSSGTISTLINYIFNFNHLNTGTSRLKKIYEGKGAKEDIDALMDIYEMRYSSLIL